jgi:hypothetical protein
MKRVLSTVAIGGFLCLMMTSVDFRTLFPASELKKKNCVGYTVIEAGKGVDCNGDTIKLIKTEGYYRLANI